MAEFFTFHDENTAPDESKELLAKAKEQAGFIPNLHAIMADAPGVLVAYRTLNDLFIKSSFNKEEITVIWQSINVEHECHYCVPAHTMVAKGMKVDDAITEALRNETPLADPKLEALRTFTLTVVRNRGVVDDNAIQTFLAAGFTKRNILEIVLGVAQKVMSNYINHFADTPLDKPFEAVSWEKAS